MQQNEIHMITYGDTIYNDAKKRIYNEAIYSGFFKTVKVYSPNELSSNFREKFNDILKMKRGGGYWIWKIDIIMQRLREIEDDEILLYIDSGCTINKGGKNRLNEYIQLLKDSKYGIISFQMPHYEIQWTIQELFNALSIDSNTPIGYSGQYVGGILLMKKNKHLYDILNTCIDILDYDKYLITDKYNELQKKYFIDNRHDQSLLSLVRKIKGSIIIKDETYAFDSFNVIKDEKCINYPFLATRNRSIHSIII